ncbi:unnamed protein product, partial [Brachionus calyciflorus]
SRNVQNDYYRLNFDQNSPVNRSTPVNRNVSFNNRANTNNINDEVEEQELNYVYGFIGEKKVGCLIDTDDNKRQVIYLGHVVNSDGLFPCEDKVAAIKEFKTPRTIKQLQSFLDFHDTFRLETDASDIGLEAVLSQKRDGEWKSIAHWSRQLIKSEKNYSATEKEALAFVVAMEHFRVYLYGSDVLVCTNHQPLKWMMNVKDPQPRVARWIVRLSEYSFRIEYRPGKLNGNADSLSRWPIENDEKVHEKNLEADFNVIIFTDCQTDQKNGDKNIAQLIEWKNLSDSRPDVKGLTGELRTLWLQWNRLTLINGVLYRSWKIDGDTVRYQYVVSIDKRSVILKQMHDSEFEGHFGCVGTTGKIESKY